MSEAIGDPAIRTPVQIDVVSDVVCPWCYIGKRNLEAALATHTDLAVTLHWRPYQLDPTIPAGGYERQSYIARKFGGRADGIYARIAAAAREAGLDLAFERIRRSPNTLDAQFALIARGVPMVAACRCPETEGHPAKVRPFGQRQNVATDLCIRQRQVEMQPACVLG